MTDVVTEQGTAQQTAQQTREEIQQTVREAVEAARAAAAEARAEADVARLQALEELQGQPAGANARRNQDDFSFRVGPDGIEIVQVAPDGTETAVPWNADNVIPPQVPQILAIIAIGLVGIIMAFPIGRAIARYIDRRGTAVRVPEEVSGRLASIEQSLDAVAIEVERMSEANRYTTKLLSERVTAPDFSSAARAEQERVHAQAAPHRSDSLR